MNNEQSDYVKYALNNPRRTGKKGSLLAKVVALWAILPGLIMAGVFWLAIVGGVLWLVHILFGVAAGILYNIWYALAGLYCLGVGSKLFGRQHWKDMAETLHDDDPNHR